MHRIKFWRSGPWLLVLALLFAQQFAGMHRITHGPASTVECLAASTASSSGAADTSRWTAGLFSGHDSDAGCQLLDATGQGAASAVAALVLPTASAAGVLAFFQLAVVAVSAAPFEARGPPAFR